MDPWVWAVLLLVVGMCLVVVEIFVPSGGILAVLTIVAVIAAIGLAFYQNFTVGITILGAAVLGMPVVIGVALKILPDTKMGQRVLLQPPTADEVLPETSQRQTLQALVGKLGRAKSDMYPSGIVEIERRSYDAVGEGMAIAQGQHVRVIEVRGNRLIVEGVPEPEVAVEDPLARPVDWDELGPAAPTA